MPKAQVNENAYTVASGPDPDPNLPELQQTFGCHLCEQRFAMPVDLEEVGSGTGMWMWTGGHA